MNVPAEKPSRILLCGGLAACLLLSTACAPRVEETASGPAEAQSTRLAGAEGETCTAHGSPKELCFICDASLRDEGRLWCREHGRYEDRCFECHPELRDEDRLFCEEHALYEDECFFCHPELLDEGGDAHRSQASESPTTAENTESDLMCEEHGVLERECGICHPELLAQCSPDRGMKVRLSSPASASLAGVVVGRPEARPMSDGVECLAELEFDQNRLARMTSLAGGLIRSVEVDLGSQVSRGDLLATITSAEIGEAQGGYLRALAESDLRERELERQRDLLAQQIASVRQFEEAEAAHHASLAEVRQQRQRLMMLGFDDGQIQSLAGERSTPGVLELRAPFDGEIVERTAVQGAVVEVTDELFTLADPSILWAMVSLPESELARVSLGQSVELDVDALPGHEVTGTLTWLSAMVDQRTRRVRGRVEVANGDRKLKAHMFARARILASQSTESLVVPTEAVHQVTGTPVVFLQAAEDLFEARPVRLGFEQDGRVEVVAGLTPDDLVVVAGGFALKSQLLASRLGAGCVDE